MTVGDSVYNIKAKAIVLELFLRALGACMVRAARNTTVASSCRRSLAARRALSWNRREVGSRARSFRSCDMMSVSHEYSSTCQTVT